MGEKIYTLRIDEDLFNEIKISADKNKRSIAKEIEYILDFHYHQDTPFNVPDDIAIKFIEFLRHSPEFRELEKRIENS